MKNAAALVTFLWQKQLLKGKIYCDLQMEGTTAIFGRDAPEAEAWGGWSRQEVERGSWCAAVPPPFFILFGTPPIHGLAPPRASRVSSPQLT